MGKLKGSDMSDKEISRRDYFAGQAMAGLCAATCPDGTWAHDRFSIAKRAINYADTIIELLDADDKDKGGG